MQKTLSEELAEFGCGLTFDRIPDDVIEKTKQLILDTVAIIVSSTRMPFGQRAIDLIGGLGGAAQSTVFGLRHKVPAQSAALCNGILAHGQDYDDTHTEAVVHATAALFPAALAVAEQTGASGRDMLTALVVGTEAAIRIGLPVPNQFHQHGFHTTTVATVFGATLIAAKLKGFDARQAAHALGTAGSFVGGLVECVAAGVDAKRLHAGWGGQCGIIAAQFAEAGYSGPLTVFEGKFGLYKSMLGNTAPELSGIFKALGQSWEILNIRPKLYPCCHFLHAYLDCAKTLQTENAIAPAQIENIDCRVAQGAVNIVCEPWDKKLRPTTEYGARFSLPFAVSLMLARGRAGTDEFSATYLSDPAVQALAGKVRYKVEPRYQVKDMPGWVQITLTNGQTYVRELPCVRGDKNNPIHDSEINDKFEANASFLSKQLRTQLVSGVMQIDQLQGIGELAECFSSPELTGGGANERGERRAVAKALL